MLIKRFIATILHAMLLNLCNKLTSRIGVKEFDTRELCDNVNLVSCVSKRKFPSTNIFYIDLVAMQNIIRDSGEPVRWAIVKSHRTNFVLLLLRAPHTLKGQTFYDMLGQKNVNYDVDAFDDSFHCIENCIKKCGDGIEIYKEDMYCPDPYIYYMVKISLTSNMFVIDGDYFIQILGDSIKRFSLHIVHLTLIHEKKPNDGKFTILICLKKNASKTTDAILPSITLQTESIREEKTEDNKNWECWKVRGMSALHVTSMTLISGIAALWGYSLLD